MHSKVDAEFGYKASPNPSSNKEGVVGIPADAEKGIPLAVHTVPYGNVDNGLSSPSLAREKEWEAPDVDEYIRYAPPNGGQRS